MNQEQIAVANRTSRNMGAVGAKALVPRYVRRWFGDLQGVTVLDFGAGKHAAHALAMRHAYGCEKGVHGWTVDAYEFGANVVEGVHLTEPEARAKVGFYSVVYASNVLNVQGSYSMLGETVRRAREFMRWQGRFICNYPASPRKSDMTAADVEAVLELYFTTVCRVGGTNSAPVWSCTNGQTA